MVWTARILTLFPAMFPGPLGQSLAGQALEKGLWRLDVTDIRDFATDRHRSVDDTPFGGGPGMVMRADIVDAALAAVLGERPRPNDATQPLSGQNAMVNGVRPGPDAGNAAPGVASAVPLVYFTPRGRPLDQGLVRELAASDGAVLLCGRFEGIDQRVIEQRSMLEVSLGDFVLSGGEIAALALIDAVVRLLPGVMGDAASATEESFADGLLEYPQYTRPQVWQGQAVPEVLLSGHHEKIATWRRQAAEEITKERRPDLWALFQKRRKG